MVELAPDRFAGWLPMRVKVVVGPVVVDRLVGATATGPRFATDREATVWLLPLQVLVGRAPVALASWVLFWPGVGRVTTVLGLTPSVGVLVTPRFWLAVAGVVTESLPLLRAETDRFARAASDRWLSASTVGGVFAFRPAGVGRA